MNTPTTTPPRRFFQGMLPDVKKLWLERLRDPRAKQAQHKLGYRTPEGDECCCLGHLALVLHDHNKVPYGCAVTPAEKNAGMRDRVTITGPVSGGGGPNAFGLPERFRDKLGLSSHDALLAARANDRWRLTLPQIADMIETGEVPATHASNLHF